MTLDLPLEEPTPSDIDELLGRIDAALDASFLGELADAFARAAAARLLELELEFQPLPALT